MVPADARLIEAHTLQSDESTLTGESVPVDKDVELIKVKTILAERKNCVYKNTIITHGSAKAVVFGTGSNTEVGKIAHLIQEAEEKQTPLQKSLASVAKTLGIAVVFISIAVFMLEIYRGGLINIFDAFLTAVALAVAAVPEGLPAVITITLALGLERLVKSNAIVRKLPAVETLGSTNFICTDKTGTLTENQMTVRKMYANEKFIDVEGEGYEPKGAFKLNGKVIDPRKDKHTELLIRIGVLCNTANLSEEKKGWSITGDPTEGSLIVLGAKAKLIREDLLKKYKKVGELSFDADRKRMSTIHHVDGKNVAFVKGAPDVMLEHCSKIFEKGKVRNITSADKKKILKAVDEMAKDALRVLGLAYRDASNLKKYSVDKVERDMVFVGLVGMIDPPRPEAREALKLCKQAGIKVAVVTGDHKLTAEAIGRDLGLLGPDVRIIDGVELDKMSEAEFKKNVDKIGVYARVSPEHKVKIVNALQKKGYIVAMTGDGVNDAPALKNANIGVAMGLRGTDVAKEAADMILEDDNFATIVKAIREGRVVYANIRKFLKFLLSSNLGEVFTIFGASLLGLPLPLLAVQILWMNLLTDGLPAVALSVDPPNKDIMLEKPRRLEDHPIDRPMIRNMLLVGVTMMVATLMIYKYMLSSGALLEHAQTMAFSALVMTQLVRVFSSKTDRSLFKGDLFNNKYLLGAVAFSLLLQLVVVYTPFLQPLFYTTSLSITDWVLVSTVSVSVLVVVELEKFFVWRARKKHL
jgi:Ca2+-transporting ATPase